MANKILIIPPNYGLRGAGMNVGQLIIRLRESFKSGERMPYSKAKSLADTVKNALMRSGVPDAAIEYGGSLRRQSSTVGDVDIAIFDVSVNAEKYKAVIEKLKLEGHDIKTEYTDPAGKTRKMPLGDAQTSFILDGENVDLKTYDPKFRGAMMVHITGSKDFNVGMRSWLKSFGWAFSQAGLKNEKGELLAAEDEEEIFKKMGMPFVSPKDRDQFRPPTKKPGGSVTSRQSGVAQDKKGNDNVTQDKDEAGYWRTPVPPPIYDKLPPEVKEKLKDFKLPTKDESGIAIPARFLWDKSSRNQYYRMRGKFRIPDELKLDRYMGGL